MGTFFFFSAHINKQISILLLDGRTCVVLRILINEATACGGGGDRAAVCMEIQKTEDRINARFQVL